MANSVVHQPRGGSEGSSGGGRGGDLFQDGVLPSHKHRPKISKNHKLGWRLVSKHGLFSGSMLIWRRVFCSWWWFEAYIYEILRDLCAFFVTFWVHLTKLLDVFRGLKLATSFWVYRFPTCSNCADLTIIAKCPQGPRACLSSEFLKVGMLQKKSAPTISVFLLQDTRNQAVPVDFSLMDPGWEDFPEVKKMTDVANVLPGLSAGKGQSY